MEKNKRLFLSMSEEDVAKLDRLKDELGMNRSQYIRYLISGQKKILPGVLRDKKLIDTLSEINLELQVIALSAIGAVMLVYGGIKFAMAFRQMDQQGEHQAVYSVVAGGVLVGLSALVTALT